MNKFQYCLELVRFKWVFFREYLCWETFKGFYWSGKSRGRVRFPPQEFPAAVSLLRVTCADCLEIANADQNLPVEASRVVAEMAESTRVFAIRKMGA